MEGCSPISSQLSTGTSLFKSLALLHHFHIVHLDIKPVNVMFSYEYNQPIFIDFGLSQLISTDVGYKKKTRFSGNLTFCSQ